MGSRSPLCHLSTDARISSRAGAPQWEREVLDLIDDGGAACVTQRRKVGPSGHEPRHALVIRDRNKQGPVGVAVADDGIDLERGPAGVRRVRAMAVVHDALEHRQRHDPHETILPVDEPELMERLRAAGDAILDGVGRELPGWIIRSVDRIIDAWGRLTPAEVDAARAGAQTIGPIVAERVDGELRALFRADPADQRSTPLNIVRTAYREPTDLLEHYGIPPVVRDSFDERHAPADRYDLSPRSMADLGDPDLGPVMLAWGMTKARVLRARVAPAE